MPSTFNDRKLRSLLKEGSTGRHAIGNGLYFRITPESNGFFVQRYTIHKKRREMTLGQYPLMSLADANEQTILNKAQIKRGLDPLAERTRGEKVGFTTVNDLAKDWLEFKAKQVKRSEGHFRIYNNEIAPVIGNLALDQVTPRDIRHIIHTIAESGRISISNSALHYCIQIFNHGIKLDVCNNNPAQAFTIKDAGGKAKSGTRNLSLDEITDFFGALRKIETPRTEYKRHAFALLLLLGVRKSELLGAKVAEFDLNEGLWYLPAERTKTKAEITIPLSQQAAYLVKLLVERGTGNEYLLPSFSVRTRKLPHLSETALNNTLLDMFKEKHLAMPHFSVHDLRRTCRSLLSSEGVEPHIAERCLNHKLRGVEGVYDRYDYLDERRAALDKLANLVSPLTHSPCDEIAA